MKVEFVNHSSFIVEHNGVRIICDPWLEGSVFNNGWSLISKTKLQYDNFSSINYIWFSHEHPDHFSPPSLKKIPAEIRKNIVVLFQETRDKRVVEFCKKQGFKQVIELYPDKWESIGSDFEIMNNHYSEGDSWICFKGGGELFLNTNDCGIETIAGAESIQKKIGGEVNVLFTQFSYAYWAGNPEDTELRERMANRKLDMLKLQCDVFKPDVVVPIASYVYFSHIENFYLNDGINTPRKTFNYIENMTGSKPVVLYNGDIYNYPSPHNSSVSIENYERDFENIKNNKAYEKTNRIPVEQLEKDAGNFLNAMNSNNMFYLKQQIKPTHIYIKDYECSYALQLDGFVKKNMQENDCDVSMTSENLQFCFLFPYGLDTTQINGRLMRPLKGNYRNFYNFFRINQLKSRGINPNSPVFLAKALYRKVFSKLEYHELIN